MFAEFLANKMEMTFSQEHICRCRNLMALSILQGELCKPILSGYKLQMMEIASKIWEHKNGFIIKNVIQSSKIQSKMSENEKLVHDVKKFFDTSG